ncbi:MAG: Asp-tRNA(Asn)/Glu-tRNA(Gln) amidotransferase subunit GatB [Candidatus Abyssobacteria bacterium SURF_17]|uniref:Aspartyl/glutamyl-tRNA(Asn/Gln) amidotransferase subunit B n=1 Tax=Candidatus Abyssobacteria bacterium SURF_17 TaxID=2093361 RepID=A0A419EQU3_9BACT|nr:MAG: Asp-tRNA(Asn)/Glu-tRNA(Gln) amidotransferase subunit GatB [Candidatus Abyssubacteria bacterium SURF_17]
MEYEAVIGLEFHAQLSTQSKIFCECSTKFGAEPNTQVCPVCTGLPGVLPVLNRKVVESTIMTGLALTCEIAKYCKFARKNYFYPDLPKNYQISQYEDPLAKNGVIEIPIDGTTKRIGITRVHMEEDAGKLIHPESGHVSYVDFNRTGVPLMEIVTEPDIRSPEEAYSTALTLKSILEYLEVSDCNMEEGSLRCDANISIRPKGATTLGVKTEVKNMNSFKAVQKALEYEVARQEKVLAEGGIIVQETRLWDADRGVTRSMRSKEEAHDYRYFPEPDLIPLIVDDTWINEIRARLPELPHQRKRRLQEDYGIPEYDAGVLTASKYTADFFEQAARLYSDAKSVSNWVMGELQRYLNQEGIEIQRCKVTPEKLAELLKLIDDGVISGKIAKDVFGEIFRTGEHPAAIVKAKGLVQIADEDALVPVVNRVIEENPGPVADFLSGNERTFGFLMGQAMKATKGKANPKALNKILRERLKKH